MVKKGNEKRDSILPSLMPKGLGFFGSPYSPADALPMPNEINVRTDDTLDSVIDAVKGVAYYTDVIGFGESTNVLSRDMGLQPLGVNYFMNTGQVCSNGATMWQYFEGIPNGDALGAKIGRAMAAQNMSLKGLVPGMIEDVEGALNPSPLLNAMLGSGYPKCKSFRGQVGDLRGRIADPETGKPWIDSPQTAVRGNDGRYYQTRWIQATDNDGKPITLTKDKWKKTPKTMNLNGSPKRQRTNEKFTAMMLTTGASIAVVSILLLLAYGFLRKRR